MELIEQGEIRRNQISLSPELIAAFLKLWQVLGYANHNADIELPFFHLRGDKFWYFKAKPGFEALLSSGAKVRTISTIGQAIDYAYLDDELFAFLQRLTMAEVAVKEVEKEITVGNKSEVVQNFLSKHEGETHTSQEWESKAFSEGLDEDETDELMKCLDDSHYR
ncbi:hypothetical protein F7734_54005 [Scytonema sp. UIC 10036]|uniref:hypothetical protein n=1 Tax=Scytonema sp. UIC 10036 TaxID=2304196 RepID=UPI0012DA6BDA|nr:hypothetical protein [Scytonema sp. UIC 10036]MUH00720.1 hypothetical protein [Scytonema sp. UIC 10036]